MKFKKIRRGSVAVIPLGLIAATVAVQALVLFSPDSQPEWDFNNSNKTQYLYGKPILGGQGEVRVYEETKSTPVLTFSSTHDYTSFGMYTASAGDLDGDGLDDLVVGAPFNSVNGTHSGAVYAISTGTGDLLFGVLGPNGDTELGRSVAGVGDIDGDGIPDLAAGGFDYYPNTNNAFGVVYLISGATGETLGTLNSSVPNDGFGYTICGMPDQDGDGALEVAVAAPLRQTSTFGADGYVFVFSGAVAPGDNAQIDTDALVVIENEATDRQNFASILIADDTDPTQSSLIVGSVDPPSLISGNPVTFYLLSYDVSLGQSTDKGSAPGTLMGDLTGDGQVTEADIEVVINNLGQPADDNQPFSGDVDGNGDVQADDLAIVLSQLGQQSSLLTAMNNVSPLLSRVLELTTRPSLASIDGGDGDCGPDTDVGRPSGGPARYADNGCEDDGETETETGGETTGGETGTETENETDGETTGQETETETETETEDDSDGDPNSGCNADLDPDADIAVDIAVYLPQTFTPLNSQGAYTRVANEFEASLGTQLWVNFDNDDADEYFDLEDQLIEIPSTDPDSDTVYPDNDLARVVVTAPGNINSSTVSTRIVIGGQGAGNVRLWRDKSKTTEYVSGTYFVSEDYSQNQIELWLEGVYPSESLRDISVAYIYENTDPDNPLYACDRFAATVLAIKEYSFTGEGNSIDDTDELDLDPNFPEGLGMEGYRVFPGKRPVGVAQLESESRFTAYVEAILNLPPPHSFKITLGMYDIDDPSATNTDYASTGIYLDDESSDEDNYRDVFFDHFLNPSGSTGANDQTVVLDLSSDTVRAAVRCSHAPGDNIRVAAHPDEEIVESLNNNETALGTLLEDKLRVVDPLLAGEFREQEFGAILLPEYRQLSPVLTMWRKAYFEIDTYMPVGSENIKSGNLVGFGSEGNQGSFVATSVSLSFDQPRNHSEFENGKVWLNGEEFELGFIPEVIGHAYPIENGPRRLLAGVPHFEAVADDLSLRMVGELLYVTPVQNGTIVRWNYLVSQDIQYFSDSDGDGELDDPVDAPSDWTALHGGRLIINGGESVGILSASDDSRSLVSSFMSIPVLVADDDTLPGGAIPEIDMSMANSVLADAYVHAVPELLPGSGAIAWQEFDREGLAPLELYQQLEFENRAVDADPECWIIYMASGFQATSDLDRDPDIGGALGGFNIEGFGAVFVDQEVFRDYNLRPNTQVYQEHFPGTTTAIQANSLFVTHESQTRSVAHEIGHAFGCDHHEMQLMGGGNLFEQEAYRSENLVFSQESLRTIRRAGGI